MSTFFKLLCVLVSIGLVSDGAVAVPSHHFGTIEIFNADDTNLNTDIIEVVLENDCNSLTVQERGDIILEHFSCLSLMETITATTLSSLHFSIDNSNPTCIDDPYINFDSLCIRGVEYDSYSEPLGVSGECIFRRVTASDLPGDESWALSLMDGIDDGWFKYYRSDSAQEVDLYIMDTGIQHSHDEFTTHDGTTQVETIQIDLFTDTLFENVEYFHEPSRGGWDHGTGVASAAAGYSYGVARGQRIYNLNTGTRSTDDDGNPIITNDGVYIERALTVITVNLRRTNRKGVINMSFGSRRAVGSPVREMREDLIQYIRDSGGILVAAAGNDGNEGCVYPADSPNVISVGSHNQLLDASSFSQYGDCVDVWAPGAVVELGKPSANDPSVTNFYATDSGTSFASPYVAGVISSWLMECEDTNYHVPCEWDNIVERLQSPSQVVSDATKCDNNFDCPAVRYQCDRPFYPRPIEECTDPQGYCDESEAGICHVYHDPPGCSQCVPGYFKMSYNHPCVHCRFDIMGLECRGCIDFFGCCDCFDMNLFEVALDQFSGMYYCKPQPCLNPANNCQVCNNGKCSQCVGNLQLDGGAKSCS